MVEVFFLADIERSGNLKSLAFEVNFTKIILYRIQKWLHWFINQLAEKFQTYHPSFSESMIKFWMNVSLFERFWWISTEIGQNIISLDKYWAVCQSEVSSLEFEVRMAQSNSNAFTGIFLVNKLNVWEFKIEDLP